MTTVVCIADGPTFGDADGIPVLVRNVICTGNEDHLNNCQYELAGPNETCGAVAGVVCVKRKKLWRREGEWVYFVKGH